MTWFIVVGRAYGDDEATALKLQATNSDQARTFFQNELRGDDWKEDHPTLEGWDTVWIDDVFDCGETEPKEVS